MRPLHFVIALPAEAKPLRQALGLQRDPRCQDLALYRAGPLRLALSGPGRAAAAGAVARLGEEAGAEAALWLNLGIAGHPEQPLGALIRAAAVTCASVRLPLGVAPFADLPAADLYTLDRPRFDYRLPGLADLEGFGFAQALRSRFPGASPLILKLVSDNRHSAPGSIRGRAVEAWVRAALPRILGPLQAFGIPAEACA